MGRSRRPQRKARRAHRRLVAAPRVGGGPVAGVGGQKGCPAASPPPAPCFIHAAWEHALASGSRRSPEPKNNPCHTKEGGSPHLLLLLGPRLLFTNGRPILAPPALTAASAARLSFSVCASSRTNPPPTGAPGRERRDARREGLAAVCLIRSGRRPAPLSGRGTCPRAGRRLRGNANAGRTAGPRALALCRKRARVGERRAFRQTVRTAYVV